MAMRGKAVLANASRIAAGMGLAVSTRGRVTRAE